MKTMLFITLCLLSTLSYIITAQNVPTKAEIFDFDIGDEFHKQRKIWSWEDFSYYSSGLSIEKVIDKIENPLNDQISYVIWKHYEFFGSDNTIESIDTVSYTDLSQLSIDTLGSNDLQCHNYTVYNSADLYNNQTIVSADFSHFIADKENLDFFELNYATGLGEVHKGTTAISAAINQLVFFKRGASTWGTPLSYHALSAEQYSSRFITKLPLHTTIFTSNTIISYYLPSSDVVRIVLYDMQGNVVQNLVNNHQAAGMHHYLFSKNDLASGVYTCVFWSSWQCVNYKLVK